MFVDSDRKAEDLASLQPSAPEFARIILRSGAHNVHVQTERWLNLTPRREQCVCRPCALQATEDEQHFLCGCCGQMPATTLFTASFMGNTFLHLFQTANSETPVGVKAGLSPA